MNSKRVLIFLASMSVFAVCTAFAAMGPQGPGAHGHGSFGIFSPKVVEQLHLNSAQTKTLESIQSERKTMFTQMREQHEAMMKSMQTALKSDTPDLRALAQQRDAAMDQMRTNMQKIQGEELNLYDTLTPQQKKVVRDALLKRMSYMEKHHDWQKHHDWKSQQPNPPNTDSGPSI
ncbi:MAG: Spy/CpxP family protein refolding chaperone [Gammaproteobacteria bacterium]